MSDHAAKAIIGLSVLSFPSSPILLEHDRGGNDYDGDSKSERDTKTLLAIIY